jgi:hypothetical protein
VPLAFQQLLHLVFYAKFEFFKPDFFEEVFRTEVRREGQALEFCFVLRVLFGQLLIFGIRIEILITGIPLQTGHASSCCVRW